MSLDIRAPQIILSPIKPRIVSQQSSAVNNPHHISVKSLTCNPF